MDVHLLIETIVRQTTVLIAQLATTAGIRAPLAHTANKVFIDLARELREQGLSAKVIADMFGLSLRTYHNTVRRLSEGNTVRGQSLWEAVLGYIRDHGTVPRSQVLARFRRDEDQLVRGVLKDLVDSSLVFQTGRGTQLAYRAAGPDELPDFARDCESGHEPLIHLVWVTIYRTAPVSFEQIAKLVPGEAEALESALQVLLADKRVQLIEIGGVAHYTSDRCSIPVGSDVGWEAAVFDHYQAMVTAIAAKLRLRGRYSEHAEVIGGSTYSCDVWDGHPLRDEALGLLRSWRERGADLVRRVDAYNASHAPDTASAIRVYAYVGQNVIAECEETEEDKA